MADDAAERRRNLYIAHRRLPSELTLLMVEQYNLQRQLEAVQLQQKHILAQTLSQAASQLLSQAANQAVSHAGQGHSRLPLYNGHRHTNLGGHARRHLLGLNEAIRAAATQRQNQNMLELLPGGAPASGALSSGALSSGAPLGGAPALSDYPDFSFPQSPTHLRLRLLAYGQTFKFPPEKFNVSPDRGHSRRLSHFRSNSRGDMAQNWRHARGQLGTLEPPLFVPGHKGRSSLFGLALVLLFLLFMPNSNGRKLLFAPYLPQLLLPDLIADGRLVTGILRVNKKNRLDAYVLTDGLLDADIFICGSKDRNRALEGDLVAVELLVVDEVWELKKEKEEKKRRKDKEQEHDDDGLARRGSLKQRPTTKKNDDVEVEGQALLLVEEEEISDDAKPLYAGHVVAVVDRIPGQTFAGTLGLLRPAQANQAAMDRKTGKEPSVQPPKQPKIVWFKPTDKRVPLIAIPTEQAPKDFVENSERYADQLFVASIKRWPITLLHPFGTLVCKLGALDEPLVEIDLILRDNNFVDEHIDEPVADVAAELLREARHRYVEEYVVAFTQTGDFCDHALHVKRLSSARIELGFHVVDVAAFVAVGLALERKAKKRLLSVFLPQRVATLYPPQANAAMLFAENAAQVALLVVFEIDTFTFEVELVHLRELVVVPKLVVAYDAVDAILADEPPAAISLATLDYIKTFALIAKEFRRQRLEDRTVGIAPLLTLLDQIDDEKARLHMNVYEGLNAQRVFAELSHKVNAAVAARVHAQLGDEAFLRRQPLPTLHKLEAFVRKAAQLGFAVDTCTLAALQRSVLAIEDPTLRMCVETLLYKCMPRARYFVAGKQDADSYAHYLHNVPLYTHFTAPLRRFADLVVHRQVKSLFGGERFLDAESLKAVADYCNFKKDCAANAQEQAVHLLLSQTINELSGAAGHLVVVGTVVQVYELAFDVLVPEFGIEKRVHGDQLPLEKAEYDKATRTLELYWEPGVDLATYVPPDEKLALSYRLLVRNRHRALAVEAAKLQRTELQKKAALVVEKLAAMHLLPPPVAVPASVNGDELAPYCRDVVTRTEGTLHIQEIRELRQVPVLLRAEIGMALPCLTVRVLNPFA